uniref:Fungal lipase-type domain-containing protein n=1 Tax=Kalanchoe fedtschenkoi TaxID=63787 RepID=A0A7N0SVP6_KALFE
MVSDRYRFDRTGPLHLSCVDWNNIHHRRSVAASLVQGVYILERDRQENRQGSDALATPWWDFFNFELLQMLVDGDDQSIFGAIYHYQFSDLEINSAKGAPHYVIAFRGTITKGNALTKDMHVNLELIKNGLNSTPLFEAAMSSVQHVASIAKDMNFWLTGHSLGSSMAMKAGRYMANGGIFLEAHLFNPPFLSAPIERIKSKKVKHGLRFVNSLVKAGLATAVKTGQRGNHPEETFRSLSEWTPNLYVHPSDVVCSEYVGYFEHRKKMEEMGAGHIEKLATQHSIASIFMSAIGKHQESLHLIPSAILTVNQSHAADFKQAHGIHQWWSPDLNLHSNIYKYGA